MRSINQKNELYKKHCKRPDDATLKNKYLTYKNKLVSLIKKTKHDFYKSKIMNKALDNKQLYRTVKNLCGSTIKATSEIKSIKLEGGDVVSTDVDIAEKMNEYFSTIGEKLASKLIKHENTTNNILNVPETIYLDPVTSHEVDHIISHLKKNKAPGHDSIRSELLIEIKDTLLKPLEDLINNIITGGQWPTALKIGVIKPIFKSGSPTEIKNYRPITLITSLAKIVETAVNNRLQKFLDKHNILSNRQFGFRKAKSTEDAIATLSCYLHQALDSSHSCLGVFLDLAKAFDTISHDKLLDKLFRYGIRGISHQLLGSYLRGRKQVVQINDSRSTCRETSYGVPQGTILGPLLFILYMNDLLNLDVKGQIISYADDTVILYEQNSWSDLKTTVENDFKKVKDWLDNNLLTLNHDKTVFLNFTSYSSNLPDFDKLHIVCDDHYDFYINSKESIKYLGITIDRHLRWNLHINQLVSKIRSMLDRFRFLRNIFSVNYLKTLYFSLIQSHLTYGIVAWGSANDNILKYLMVIQKWIIKIIYNKRRTYPSDNLFTESRLFDIRQLYALSLLKYSFNHPEYISFTDHDHHTRFKALICNKNKYVKTIGQKCFVYILQKLNDNLPAEIKLLKDLKIKHSYINRVKIWLSETPRRVIHDMINT